MKKHLYYLPLITLFLAGALADAKTITIYHTGDIHGQYMATTLPPKPDGTTSSLGGFAAFSNFIKKEGKPDLLLDSGDWYQGTPEGGLTKGMASMELMNKMDYTATVVGNHDFDYGQQNITSLCSAAKFPVLGANVYAGNSLFQGLKPYKIFTKGGYKIAVVGFMPPGPARAIDSEYTAGLTFTDPKIEIKRILTELDKQQVDAVIVLSHQGICYKCPGNKIDSGWQPTAQDITEGNISIARAVPGKIALMFGGHTHITLTNGYFDTVSSTTFAESGSKLTTVSRVVMDFDDTTRKLKNVKVTTTAPWLKTYGEDPEMTAMLKKITDTVAPGIDAEIGRAEQAIPRYVDGRLDGPLGNWITDVMAKSGGTQIAMQQSAGIRGVIPQGPVTGRTIFNVMPFDNTLVTMKLTGKQIYTLIKQSVTATKTNTQVSGMTVEIQPVGYKITVGGEPLDPAKVYTVATNDYSAGWSEFKNGTDKVDTKITLRDVLLNSVKAQPNVVAPSDIRIK